MGVSLDEDGDDDDEVDDDDDEDDDDEDNDDEDDDDRYKAKVLHEICSVLCVELYGRRLRNDVLEYFNC